MPPGPDSAILKGTQQSMLVYLQSLATVSAPRCHGENTMMEATYNQRVHEPHSREHGGGYRDGEVCAGAAAESEES